MDPDPKAEASAPSPAQPESSAQPGPKPSPGRKQVFVSTVAVVAVAGAALAAAIMGSRHEAPAAGQQAAATPTPRPEVVRAPPLVVTAPPLKPVKPAARERPRGNDARVAANAMGAGTACRNCGVIESVAASGASKGFQMRIRMDDGTLRTVEQRGALAAGTRVVVDGASVRLMPGPTG